MMTDEKKTFISNALKIIKAQLGDAKLVAVTKHTGIEEITYAYEMGQRIFGESRVQDLLKKSEQLGHLKDIEWHFIGHLQRNKVKDILHVEGLTAIHSVDSLALLEKIIEASPTHKLNLLFEVNTSMEKEKWGFSDLKLLTADFLKALQEGAAVQTTPVGLMTMGTFRTNDVESEAHRCFQQLHSMKLDIEKALAVPPLKLSMGMSSDYKIALQHGADYIRIGSQIFG